MAKNKKDAEKKAGARRRSKKAIATQPATGVITTEPLVLVGTVTRKSTPKMTLAQETAVVAAPTRGRSNKQPVARSREDNALSTLKFSPITDDGSRGAEFTDDVTENALSIALVATALGKKVPRVTPTHDVVELADCYVELSSLRRKAKNQVSVAPPNSIDSNDGGRGSTGSELRLTQSDVHIGFPGDVCGTTENVGPGLGDHHKAGATVGRPSGGGCANSEAVTADPVKAAEVCSVAMIAEGDGGAVLAIAMSGAAACGEN